MLWFRLGAGIFLIILLIWEIAVGGSVVEMFSIGASLKSMVDDPSRNGTLSMYILLMTVELFLFFITIFGIFIAFRMWRNNFQMDHNLRHQFILWLSCWGGGFGILLSIGIYMVVRAKDNQENMAVLYDTFFRNSQDQKFVATFEKFQRENQCCGIYTPNDWFNIQFKQRGVGGMGAGGGGGGFQDYDGYNQNPSTGKCHLTPPTIPPGCGVRLNDEIQFKMKIFAACAITQTIVGLFTGGLCWYCFFYWLEKDVIVIPEDEVSNVIIIEPESEATLEISSSESGSGYLSETGYFDRSRGRLSYMPLGSHSHRRSGYLKEGSYGGYLHNSRISNMSRNGNHGYLPPQHGSHYHSSRSQSHPHNHEHDHHHHHHPHKIHLSHSQILHEQEEAIGGHVLKEMHVDHKSTKMLQAQGSNAGQHHATVALVRNTHPKKKDVQKNKHKSHHGQTGNLAQDIADMSGKSARGYIEDVVVPIEPPGHKPHAIQVPLGASVHSHPPSGTSMHKDSHEIRAGSAQNVIEDLMSPKSRHKDKKSHKSVVINQSRKKHHHHPHAKDGPREDAQELSRPQVLAPLGHHDHDHHHHHHDHDHDHHHHPHHHHSHHSRSNHHEHHHGHHSASHHHHHGGGFYPPHHHGHTSHEHYHDLHPGRYRSPRHGSHEYGHHHHHENDRRRSDMESRMHHHHHSHSGHRDLRPRTTTVLFRNKSFDDND